MHDTDTDTAERFAILPLVQPNPDGSPIDRAAIRGRCRSGLWECPVEDRCIAWLVLLGVFPDDALDWPDTRASLVSEYAALVSDLGTSEWHKVYVPPNPQREFFQVPNDQIMWAVHGDIIRTGRHVFFLPPCAPPDGAPDDMDSRFALHMRRLERLLYIFAVGHQELQYVQGFNELAAILYFVNMSAVHYLGDDPLEVEALTYYSFKNLMLKTDIISYYTTGNEARVIEAKMSAFFEVVKLHLPDVHEALLELGIVPLHFSYRWFILLFAQDHPLPVLLQIWDSLFAHFDDLMTYVGYVAIAHMEVVHDRVVSGDFAQALSSLQNPEINNIVPVLKRAADLYRKDHDPTLVEKFAAFLKRFN
jgi:hypothetical protein